MKTIGAITVLLVTVLAVSGWAAEKNANGTLSGKFLLQSGEPMAEGMVLIHQEAKDRPFAPDKFRREPFQVAEIDAAGNFSIDLPPGRYVLEALQRESRYEVGPPRNGDIFFSLLDPNGGLKPYTVRKDEETDIGVIAGGGVYQRLESSAVTTGISGVVKDKAGKPLADAVVMAYKDPAMSGEALFLSDRTGKDGRYLLGIDQGSTFYLQAMDMSGVPPSEIGMFGGKEAAPVVVGTGEVLDGVDIQAREPYVVGRQKFDRRARRKQ